ncbi:rhamnose-binding lectin-like precursor [Ictalurus punctatus]|uniref:Rhamnose binding lectin type Ib n=1 Tax=Ictalurus punctatus TaxID=7998 RepID=W6EVW3_ICTPU|nr:rhamnose-binding lectin-like precursor [Ictalurus punctatus]AHJ14695.1 rhamnose binding lectin type Ib [Ictalurus punctatus]
MMLFLKLSLLTLIISAPGLIVSRENMITCYSHVQRLTCETGLIKVKSSVYGRTNSITCNTNRPSSEVTNTNCALRITTIADRCNGLKECELKTELLGNPDPCYGTYKYYNTTYDCINGHLVVICEQGYSTLDCGSDSIEIINANYGRGNSRTCSNGIPSFQTQNTNCYAPNTLSTVAAMCKGKKTCTVEASNTIFNDPCFGTVKYLTVSYICTREIVTCESSTATLNCGAHRIKIISANYGRTDSTTCSSGRPASQISNKNCYTPDALNKIAARCEGQSSCEVPATNVVFSDPCYGTYKYLTIVYSCV